MKLKAETSRIRVYHGIIDITINSSVLQTQDCIDLYALARLEPGVPWFSSIELMFKLHVIHLN